MFRQTVIVAAAFLGLVARAEAAPIATIDQQNTTGGSFTGANGAGQSFLPTLDRVDAFEFLLQSGGGAMVRLDLFEGGGFAGPLLGSSAAVTVGSLQMVHFDLTADLVPGQVYTARLVLTSGTAFSAAVFSGATGPYPGDSYDRFGNAYDQFDFVFVEGLHAVPEPQSLAFLCAGLAGLALARRRCT